MEISSQSLEYVKVPVSATVNGVAIDPTVDTVKLAFPVLGVDPVSGDWKDGSWETVGSTRYARCLVGSGGTVALVKGSYAVWLKVSDSPEIPIRKVGQLTVT